MGIGDRITGALKSGVARLEATQKRLEPYEKEVYEKAKAGEQFVEAKAREAYEAEKKAFPGQVKYAKKVGKKGWTFAKKEAKAGIELEKKMYPTQKKLAEKGVEFVKKGFEEAYGKGGMFGEAEENIKRGTVEIGEEDYEERPIQRMRRAKQRLAPEEYAETGPRDYIDDYMSKFEDDFWRAAESTKGEGRRDAGEIALTKKRKKEAMTPVERYLAKYEAKMARRGL